MIIFYWYDYFYCFNLVIFFWLQNMTNIAISLDAVVATDIATACIFCLSRYLTFFTLIRPHNKPNMSFSSWNMKPFIIIPHNIDWQLVGCGSTLLPSNYKMFAGAYCWAATTLNCGLDCWILTWIEYLFVLI